MKKIFLFALFMFALFTILLSPIALAADLTISSVADITTKCSYNDASRTYTCTADNIYITGDVQLPQEGRNSSNIIFVATNKFEVTGSLSANGERGNDGGWNVGPSAGGSAGQINITSNSIDLSGTISANGGDGGHGFGPMGKTAPGYDGGPAGTIILTSTNFIHKGLISANGGNGGNGDNRGYGGSGGSAGQINITSNSIDLSGTISANGGNGGTNDYNGRGGDGGSAGQISITSNSIDLNGTISANGGYGGSSTNPSYRWRGGNGGPAGSIILTSTNFIHKGLVSANGGGGGSGEIYGSGSSAGQINITSNSIDLSGTISANGGDGGGGRGRAGPAGSIILTSTNFTHKGLVSANGGDGGPWGDGGRILIDIDIWALNGGSVTAIGRNGGKIEIYYGGIVLPFSPGSISVSGIGGGATGTQLIMPKGVTPEMVQQYVNTTELEKRLSALEQQSFILSFTGTVKDSEGAPVSGNVNIYLCEPSVVKCNKDAEYITTTSGKILNGNMNIKWSLKLQRGKEYKIGLVATAAGKTGYAETLLTL